MIAANVGRPAVAPLQERLDTGRTTVFDWSVAAFLLCVAALQPTSYYYTSTQVAYFVALLFVVTLVIRPSRAALPLIPFITMVSLLMWLVVTAGLSPHRDVTLVSAWYVVKVWVMGLLILVFCRDYRQVALYLKAIVLGSFVLSVSGAVLGYPTVTLGGERIEGIAEQVNAFGASLLHGILAGIALFPHVGKLWKTIIVLYLVAAFIAMLASGSRGAAAAALTALGAYALIEYSGFLVRRPWVILPAVALVVGPVLVALRFFPDAPLVDRFAALLEGRYGATSDRVLIYEHGWALFKQHPFLGHGVGSFRVYTRWVYTHSTFLDLLLAGGVLAFLLYYSLFAYAWLLLRRLAKLYAKQVRARRTFNAWKAVLAGLIVHGAFTGVYFQKIPVCLMAALLGFVVAHAAAVKRSQRAGVGVPRGILVPGRHRSA
jgi:O-antigen ligase